MRKIIIASHHRLAQGLKDTLNYVVPNAADIIAIAAYVTNTPIDEEIQASLHDVTDQDEVIVFTDILGGSVNQAFAKFVNHPHFHVITGTNLPVIMSIMLEIDDGYTSADVIKDAVNNAKEELIYVNDFIVAQSNSDEEDE
ncbi:PTS N-acetylglucosamine transporter subunit IIBC [Affinibrenneria salicis]|uniref:PTS N-acetylglucosamine transporter subunit IIBC n=1 Tax=Affinibrenneria salicis TaxID=2590031 RepID=A0A5J5G3G0_9GAMM|nr:PTS N-acetylglucosamine transporter subunit IIBC [Affinibrenneria salicis]KAA9001262.1 PTS N-acetylglucosamine transporter subunit IIBC [Affinibrenneria salicis]